MATLEQQNTLRPILNASELLLDGTSSSFPSESRLPAVGVSSQLNAAVGDIHGLYHKMQTHIHFLSRENLTTYREHLDSLSRKIRENEHDHDATLTHLEELKNFLRSICDFIDYEHNEGLIGCHFDSGARLYLKNNSLWLCSPDTQAFADIRKDPNKIADFVRGITGLHIDPNQAIFQDQSKGQDRDLLGCRLDQLVVLDSTKPQEKCAIATHIRGNSPATFTEVKVTFSLGALQSGKVDELFQPDKLPPLNLGKFSRSPATMDDSSQSTSTKAAADAARIGTARTAAGATQVRALLSKNTTLANPAAVSGSIQSKAISAIQDQKNHLARIQANIHSLDSPQKTQQALKELGKDKAVFTKAVASQRQALLQQLQSQEIHSSAYRATLDELKALTQAEAEATIVRKKILEQGLLHGSAKEQAAFRTQLLKMRDSVDKAYQAKIQLSNDTTLRKNLEAELQSFKQFTTNAAKESSALGRLVTRAQNLATTKLQRPSWLQITPRITAWRESSALKTADGMVKDIEATQLTGLDAKKLTAHISQLEKQTNQLTRTIRTLDIRQAAGESGVVNTLKILRDAEARSYIRQAEILEHQLSATQDTTAKLAIKQTLDTKTAAIEQAYRHLGQNNSTNSFLTRQQTKTPEMHRAQVLDQFAKDNRLVELATRRKELETSLQKATSTGAHHAELLASKEAIIAAEDMRIAELQLKELESKRVFNVIDTNLEQQIQNARLELATAQDLHAQRTIASIDARLKTINEGLVQAEHTRTNATTSAEKTAATKEISTLQTKKADIQLELTKAHIDGASEPIKREVGTLRREIKQYQNALLNETDAIKRTSLQAKIAETQIEVLRKELQHMDAELRSVAQGEQQLQKLIESSKKSIEVFPSTAGKRELETLKKAQQRYEKALTDLATRKEYLEGQRSLIEVESRVERLRLLKVKIADKLPTSPTTALSSVEQARVEQLRRTLNAIETELEKSTTTLAQTQREVHGRTNQLLLKAKNALNTEIAPRFANWVKQNPIQAITIFGSLGEGLRQMGKASYEEDARHTYLPSLLTLLDSDLEDGFFGLPAEFTTTQLGQFGSHSLEFVSGAGNVVMITKGAPLMLRLGQRVFYRKLSEDLAMAAIASPSKPPGVVRKLAGRAIPVVFAGLDGYLEMNDFRTWQHANDRQLGTKVASPIVMGALYGSWFGPLGAATGATAAALGELIAVTQVYFEVKEEIDKDWRKRGIRESITRAENGYAYAADHPRVQARSAHLSSYEQETIQALTIQRVLSNLFADEKLITKTELELAGFKLGESQKDIAYNYERLEELLEKPDTTFGSDWLENDSRELLRVHPIIWETIHSLKAKHEKHLLDMYHRAARVAYENNSGGQKPTKWDEMDSFFADVALHFKTEMKKLDDDIARRGLERSEIAGDIAEVQWQVLSDRFKNLAYTLRTENDRVTFFNKFQKASGVDLRQQPFWKEKTLSASGQAFVAAYMPEAAGELPRLILEQPTQRLQRQRQEHFENASKPDDIH